MMIGSTSNSVSQCCKLLGNYSPKLIYNSSPQLKLNWNQGTFQGKYFRKASFDGDKKRDHTVVCTRAKDSGSRDEETPLETVLKLYEAMRNRNVQEISDIIAEECPCVSNFVTSLQPFHGKKKVLNFLCSLMNKLGNNNIEFVVQNTLDGGMVVVVSWELEWNNVPLPLGKGFSFYMYHVYRGKIMIKNVEIFMEPLFHIEPLKLKVITLVMNVMDKLKFWALFKDKGRKDITILFTLLIMAAIVFFLKLKLHK